MHPQQQPPPRPDAPDPFASLVEALRADFRRSFPALAAREAECFHARRDPGTDSGRVFIEYEETRGVRRFRVRITTRIKDGGVSRGWRDVVPLDESLEDTATWPGAEPGDR